MGVFHLIFFVLLHSVGRFFSGEMPCPSGPRHCGQLEPAAAAARLTSEGYSRDSASSERASSAGRPRRKRFIFWRLLKLNSLVNGAIRNFVSFSKNLSRGATAQGSVFENREGIRHLKRSTRPKCFCTARLQRA